MDSMTNDAVPNRSRYVTRTTKQHDLVFSARNAHCEEAGLPPAIVKTAGDASYHGYFENQLGEQWTLVIDRKTKTGVLRGGDLGWEEEIPITDGVIEKPIVLGSAEWTWLISCWLTAVNEPLKTRPDWFEKRLAEY